MVKSKFNCKNISLNAKNQFQLNDMLVKIHHYNDDPDNVNRIFVSNKNIKLELFPSKGLSLGNAFINDKPLFWEPPIGMPDPETLNLWSDEIAINGIPASGFTFLKTFNGGLELYGLKNWGMPMEKNGELLLLHGETSNIPVEEVELSINELEESISLTGSFIYKTMKGNDSDSWYKQGKNLCKVTRRVKVIISPNPRIEVADEFENISDNDFFIDWGYHITFRPESGAKIIIPSKRVENRSGGALPGDFETWLPANDDELRSETGIIHKVLKKFTEKDEVYNKVLIKRPALGDILVLFTPAPYTQTWMCNGGAGSKEFTWSATGEPVFSKNWDGMGIEIGASSLDNNQNTDSENQVSAPLKPWEKTKVIISVLPILSEKAKKVEKEFNEYNALRG